MDKSNKTCQECIYWTGDGDFYSKCERHRDETWYYDTCEEFYQIPHKMTEMDWFFFVSALMMTIVIALLIG